MNLASLEQRLAEGSIRELILALGNDIEGEATDEVHHGEIDVLAWRWGMNQSGSMHAGAGGGAGKVNIQDLLLTKYIDKSTPKLMLH